MKRIYITIKLSAILTLSSWSQNITIQNQKIFYGEITYDSYTTFDVSNSDSRTYNTLKQLENVKEQIFSFKDDIWITARSGQDTSTVAICNELDTYTIFYPEKNRIRFGGSKSNNIGNYERTGESMVIKGFNCDKYFYQLNDDIYIEKWISQDFGYTYPSTHKGQCHRIFTEHGLVVARKSTSHFQDNTMISESRLSNYFYDSLYVRENHISQAKENDEKIVDFKIPQQNIEYNLIEPKNRTKIQLDSLINKDNKYINADILLGNYTIINIWASWCKPCLINMPRLSELKDIFSSEGLNILSISVDQNISHEEWIRDIEKNQMNWNNLRAVMDNNSNLCNGIEISSLPKYLLLDKKGHIIMDEIEKIQSDKFELFLQDLIFNDH